MDQGKDLEGTYIRRGIILLTRQGRVYRRENEGSRHVGKAMIIKPERFSTNLTVTDSSMVMTKTQEASSSSRVIEEAPPSYDDISADPISSGSSAFHFVRPQQASSSNSPTLRPPTTVFGSTPNAGSLPERHSSYVPQSSFRPRPPPRPYVSVFSPTSAPDARLTVHDRSLSHSPSHSQSHSPHFSPSPSHSPLFPPAVLSGTEKPPIHPSSRRHSRSEVIRSPKTPHVAPVYTPKKHGWLGGGKEREIKEAREWVIGHINDLVRQTHTYDLEACNSILGACTEACSLTPPLNLSDILQVRFIDDHTPFYWSIIHRPAKARLIPDLLVALLKFGSPISNTTRADIRHACLTLHDQELFQHLRSSRRFMPRRIPEISINGKIPIDEIRVQEIPGADAVFRVDFEIPQFLKRMYLEREVSLEFIAHRRAWHLNFKSSPSRSPAEASWDLTLSLSEFSSPTYIDSQFTILETALFPPSPGPSSATPQSPSSKPSSRSKHPKPSPSMPNLLSTNQNSQHQHRNDKENFNNPSPSRAQSPRSNSGGGTLSRADKVLSSPGPMMVRLKSSSMISPGKKDVTTSLGAGSPIGTAIRLRNSDYLSSEGTLRAKLEARLTKPEPDSSCIIC
ncbi:hypothetical protein D9758_018282 [Tetrapyrgos nigripes]|uniref:Uncharacterized protein n=1 Tax=Tetrapyrgos nigripes TaxID=182062 RepID=A0A8H5C0L4_9AGAR|nr:hypothetical protein D9758_018282 [Tetrapyrgos nigripes]